MIGTDASVLPLKDYRSSRRTLYFTRSELNQLLGLYSRNVARGSGAIMRSTTAMGRRCSSVFRHTHESAVYTIVKSIAPGANQAINQPAEALFTVLSGRQRLAAGRSLADALTYFRSKLALVPTGGR